MLPTTDKKYTNVYTEALELGLPMGPEHAVLEDGVVIERLRQHTGNDRLFFYHHKFENVYVLAAWVFTAEESPNETPICIEIEIFQFNPERQRVPIELLAAKCIPVEKAFAKEVERRRSAKKKRSEDQAANFEYGQDLADHLRRQGDHETAHAIATGQMPVVSPDVAGEAGRESREELERLARVSGMSHKQRSSLKREGNR